MLNYSKYSVHNLKNILNNEDNLGDFKDVREKDDMISFSPYQKGTNNVDNKVRENDIAQKLDYIIYLLEHNNNNDTLVEDIILYLLIGFFIVYIIDKLTKIRIKFS
jgi:hypothetical protein